MMVRVIGVGDASYKFDWVGDSGPAPLVAISLISNSSPYLLLLIAVSTKLNHHPQVFGPGSGDEVF